MNSRGKKVCVVIGATSKWQADGKMTNMLHGHDVDPNVVPVGVQWGVGGAVAQKFASEGFFTVVTSRSEGNASGLLGAIRDQGGEGMVVELDLSSQDSISSAFKTIRAEAGEPDAVIYNAGYYQPFGGDFAVFVGPDGGLRIERESLVARFAIRPRLQRGDAARIDDALDAGALRGGHDQAGALDIGANDVGGVACP